MKLGLPNQITAAKAGERLGFPGKSRVGLSPRSGVAEFTLEGASDPRTRREILKHVAGNDGDPRGRR